jgi:CRP-like cAMP-binding protein
MFAPRRVERYEHFTETHPGITQRITQRIIASYLGITPEALSTAKRKQLKYLWVCIFSITQK